MNTDKELLNEILTNERYEDLFISAINTIYNNETFVELVVEEHEKMFGIKLDFEEVRDYIKKTFKVQIMTVKL